MRRLLRWGFRAASGVLFPRAPQVRQVTLEGRAQLVWAHEHVGRKIILRQFERRETAWFARQVRPGDVCVDAGANVGYYTNLFASRVGAGGRVVAVEPVRRNRLLIELATLLNRTESVVRIVPAALTESDGEVRFAVDPDSAYSHTATRTDEATQTVPGHALDSLVQELALPRVDVLKMDIEGGELNALYGMTKTLSDAARRPRVMMIELYSPHLAHHGHTIDDVGGHLDRMGYDARVLARGGVLVPFTRAHHDAVYNVFFVDRQPRRDA